MIIISVLFLSNHGTLDEISFSILELQLLIKLLLKLREQLNMVNINFEDFKAMPLIILVRVGKKTGFIREKNG